MHLVILRRQNQLWCYLSKLASYALFYISCYLSCWNLLEFECLELNYPSSFYLESAVCLLFWYFLYCRNVFKHFWKHIAVGVFYGVIILSFFWAKPWHLTRAAFVREVPCATCSIICVDWAKIGGVWTHVEIWSVPLVRIFECISFSEQWSSLNNSPLLSGSLVWLFSQLNATWALTAETPVLQPREGGWLVAWKKQWFLAFFLFYFSWTEKEWFAFHRPLVTLLVISLMIRESSIIFCVG